MGDSRREIMLEFGCNNVGVGGICVLSGICAVVHEEELNVSGVVDEENLVAGWDHVSCLLVAAITDLLIEHAAS